MWLHVELTRQKLLKLFIYKLKTKNLYYILPNSFLQRCMCTFIYSYMCTSPIRINYPEDRSTTIYFQLCHVSLVHRECENLLVTSLWLSRCKLYIKLIIKSKSCELKNCVFHCKKRTCVYSKFINTLLKPFYNLLCGRWKILKVIFLFYINYYTTCHFFHVIVYKQSKCDEWLNIGRKPCAAVPHCLHQG